MALAELCADLCVSVVPFCLPNALHAAEAHGMPRPVCTALCAPRAPLLPQVQTAARIRKLLERRAKLTSAELAMHTRCGLCLHLRRPVACLAVCVDSPCSASRYAAGMAYHRYIVGSCTQEWGLRVIAAVREDLLRTCTMRNSFPQSCC